MKLNINYQSRIRQYFYPLNPIVSNPIFLRLIAPFIFCYSMSYARLSVLPNFNYSLSSLVILTKKQEIPINRDFLFFDNYCSNKLNQTRIFYNCSAKS